MPTERSRPSEPVSDTRAAVQPGWGILLGGAGVVVAIDQATKLLVQATLTPYRPVPVIGDFFRLTYIYNPGAAFGLNVGEHSQLFFGTLAVVILGILVSFYRQTPPEHRIRLSAIALVSGGAIGNLIDRVRSPNGVIDFLDVGLEAIRWPVFNVADIAVVVGVGVLMVTLWTEDDPSDSGSSG